MSDTDFRRMQEEAARRAREMHSRARIPQNRQNRRSAQGAQSSQAASEPPKQAASAAAASSSPAASESPQNTGGATSPVPNAPQMPFIPPLSGGSPNSRESTLPIESALENLFKDKERTVLLTLLILLGAEGGNNELMFALLFLLME